MDSTWSCPAVAAKDKHSPNPALVPKIVIEPSAVTARAPPAFAGVFYGSPNRVWCVSRSGVDPYRQATERSASKRGGRECHEKRGCLRRLVPTRWRGYLLLKQSGGNVPPMWITRAGESPGRHGNGKLPRLLKGGGRCANSGVWKTGTWAYRKECFYRGIRILFELERKGKTRI